MNNIKITRNTVINSACFLLIITVMTAASEFLGEKEIIFPEIAALAIGCFMAPALPWKTSYLKMLLCIIICAVLGVLIVLYVPLPLWLQFTLAFLIGQIIFKLSKTTMAPMISAICLPVLIQTTSPVYVASAAALTLSIIVIRLILEKTGVKEKNVYQPVEIELKADSAVILMRTLAVLIMAYIVIGKDMRFCVAPPLLVAFVEFSNPNFHFRRTSGIVMIALCALTGELMRMAVVTRGIPLVLAAFAAGVMVIVWLGLRQMYLPPAGAAALLAMLIPDSAVGQYTTQVVIGIVILTVIALPVMAVNVKLLYQEKIKKDSIE